MPTKTKKVPRPHQFCIRITTEVHDYFSHQAARRDHCLTKWLAVSLERAMKRERRERLRRRTERDLYKRANPEK